MAPRWDQTPWVLGEGYGRLSEPARHVVAIDYGAKHNILRRLAGAGCQVTVVPATTSAEDILAHASDGLAGRAVAALLGFERRWIERGGRIPYGTSCVAVARRR